MPVPACRHASSCWYHTFSTFVVLGRAWHGSGIRMLLINVWYLISAMIACIPSTVFVFLVLSYPTFHCMIACTVCEFMTTGVEAILVVHRFTNASCNWVTIALFWSVKWLCICRSPVISLRKNPNINSHYWSIVILTEMLMVVLFHKSVRQR